MDLEKIYREEDLFPREFSSYAEREYGLLFFNESNRELFAACGYEVFGEENRYMVMLDDCKIMPNPLVEVRKVTAWEEVFRTDIFEAAGEPWESDVAKRSLEKENTLFFVAYADDRPVGMTRAHTKDGVCRIDYLLVATKHRRKGVGRALIHTFAAYCHENNIENCFLWPDGKSTERMYEEAGFRMMQVKTAGRAVYKR